MSLQRSILLSAAVAAAVILATYLLMLSAQSSSSGLGLVVAVTFAMVGVATVYALCGSLRLGAGFWIILASHLLMFLARPAYAVAFQGSINIFTGAPYDEFFVDAELIAGSGFVSFCIGYGWMRRAQILKRKSRSVDGGHPTDALVADARAWAASKPAMIVALCLSLALYGAYIAETGVQGYFSTLFTGRSQEFWADVRTANGYLLNGLTFAQGVIMFMTLRAMIVGRRAPVAGWLVLLVGTSVPSVAAGNRSNFIPLVLLLALFMWKVAPARVRPSTLLPLLPPLYVLGLVAPRIWRDSLAVGGTLGDSIVSATSADQLFGSVVGGYDTAMVDAFQLQVQLQSSSTFPLQGGLTYLQALGSIVPRQVWEDKPLPVDQVLNQIVFPATAAKDIGFSFSIYSEPYFNFGFLGVVLVLFLFGCAFSYVSFVLETSERLMPLFLTSLVVAYSFVLMRGSLSYDSQRFVFLMIAPVSAWIVSRLLSGPTRQVSEELSGAVVDSST